MQKVLTPITGSWVKGRGADHYIYSADSITIIEPNSSGDLDTIQTAPQLRIRLNNSIGEELIELDTSGVLDADNLRSSVWSGYKDGRFNQAMLGIDLNSEYSR